MTTGAAFPDAHSDEAATRRAEVDAEICQWLVEADQEREAILRRAEAEAAAMLRDAEQHASQTLASAQAQADEVIGQARAEATLLRAEAASAYVRELEAGRVAATRLVEEGRGRGERERAEILATLGPVRAELEEVRRAMLRAVDACDDALPEGDEVDEPPSLTIVRTPPLPATDVARVIPVHRAEVGAAPQTDPTRPLLRPSLRAQLREALPLAAGDLVRRMPRLFARR